MPQRIAIVGVLAAQIRLQGAGRNVQLKADALALSRRRMLIDVFFLRIVQAHQGLDRFDHALGVADQVAVGVGGRQVPW